MSKLKVKSRFGITPIQVLNDSNLSFKAKGLYGFIQSKPDGWQFSADRIAKQSNDGVTSVRSGLKELADSGFLVRKKYKDEKGQWEWEYMLLENPSVENPPMDSPPAEKLPSISNKEIVKKNSKKEVVSTEHSSVDVVEVIDAFRKWNKAATKWYARKPYREAISRLIQEYGKDTVLRVVAALPQSNKQKYFPTITTPVALEDKWQQLEAAYHRLKEEKESYHIIG